MSFKVLSLAMLPGGLASGNPQDVRETAKNAIKLWDQGSPQNGNAMSKRFLDAEWTGLREGEEVPLRPFIERLAQGELLRIFLGFGCAASGMYL